jgi:hypothetical protein
MILKPFGFPQRQPTVATGQPAPKKPNPARAGKPAMPTVRSLPRDAFDQLHAASHSRPRGIGAIKPDWLMTQIERHDGAAVKRTLLANQLADLTIDLNRPGKTGKTLLETALDCENREAFERLLDAGAQATIPNGQGRSPLEEARQKGWLKKVT